MKPSVILAIAVIALGLGVCGLVIGLSAKDAGTKLESRVTEVAQQAQGAATSAEQANDFTKKLRDNVQTKLTEVMSDMASLQQQISDITNKTVKVKEPKEGKEGKEGKETKGEKGKKGEKMAKPADGMYKVEKGDTVKSIAKQFGMKEHAIYEANPTLEADKPLKAGTKIKIP